MQVPFFSDFVVFTGNANPGLAVDIANFLGTTLGAAQVGRFSDGEVTVEINQNVRARDVFVVQSTCAPTNDNLMELLIMVDALKRASAGRITAALPYFGYARQDRRVRSSRVAISAKVVANMLQIAGVDRVLTMDLHADQIQGFFDIPVDNVYAAPLMLADLHKSPYDDLLVVSDLNAWYGEAHVLHGVNLRVQTGQLTTLLGRNGAGKTTTLRAVSNLLAGERGDVTKGSIDLRGERIEKLSPSESLKPSLQAYVDGQKTTADLLNEVKAKYVALSRG